MSGLLDRLLEEHYVRRQEEARRIQERMRVRIYGAERASEDVEDVEVLGDIELGEDESADIDRRVAEAEADLAQRGVR